MTIRANWHVEGAQKATQTDPFAAPPHQRLHELVEAEARLFDQGKTCHLKDRDWSHPTCITCAERGSRGALCLIGVAQEKVLNELAASRNDAG